MHLPGVSRCLILKAVTIAEVISAWLQGIFTLVGHAGQVVADMSHAGQVVTDMGHSGQVVIDMRHAGQVVTYLEYALSRHRYGTCWSSDVTFWSSDGTCRSSGNRYWDAGHVGWSSDNKYKTC